ncbi:hypothetical protein OGAPHI_001652 [Ogataea philodendri]|uniref:Pre-rRNA-processing protein FHL1 n=1 Tax=Ogataea philodendri TaxID=1378263 RepID=A0A9P8PC31_9ASCO|nr:uncharacterized protein OGAPHI_001652 [Ogataea philodendri]KAH3669056.1 hypothetical protein OGAPHI_001652 [Ogataea philodendri]
MTPTPLNDDPISDLRDHEADTTKASQGISTPTQLPMSTQSLKFKSPDRAEGSDNIQAYAMLDFENFTFYVQTMQILLGRLVEGDTSTDSLDVHLGQQKAISRRHAKIFYNFGNQRFELSVVGRNGAFVDDMFVESGVTLPLKDNTRIQIGETRFKFILPTDETVSNSKNGKQIKPINPSDAVSLKTSFSNTQENSSGSSREGSLTPQHMKGAETKSAPVLKLGDDFVNELRANAEASVVKREEAAAAAAAFARDGTSSPIPDSLNAFAGRSQQFIQSAKDRLKKPLKPVKKVYKPEEIPEEYRTKPNFSYSTLIAECLRQKGTQKGMSLSEIYKGIQELYPYYYYCPDGWQSSVRHNLSLNKSFRKVCKEGKGWLWGLDEEYFAEKERLKRKQIELANIKATQHLQTLSQQFQQQQPPRSSPETSSSPANETNTPETNSGSKLSGDTKKALSYLQKELIRLTKDRKMYDKETTTQILTQALAMTIAQVNQAAKNAGIQGFPLVTLIDKNPAHITKILSAALNAATIQVTKKKGLTPPASTPPPAPPATKPAEPVPPRSAAQQFARPSPQVPKPLASSNSIKPISSIQAGNSSAHPPTSHSPIPSIRKPQYYGKPSSVVPPNAKPVNKPGLQKQTSYDNESIQLQFQKFSHPTPPVTAVSKNKPELEDMELKMMLDNMDTDKDTPKELDLDNFLAQHSQEVDFETRKRSLDTLDLTKEDEPEYKSSKVEQ